MDLISSDTKGCAANKYRYCRGFTQRLNIIYHCTTPFGLSEEDIDLCYFHCERVLNKDRADIQGDTLDMALTTLFDNSCTFTQIYTFWYCNHHDEGFLIKDASTDVIPSWCNREHLCIKKNHTCDDLDWYQKGVINYDGQEVVELENVHVNYQRDEGGFGFTLEGYKIVHEKEGVQDPHDTYFSNLAAWLRVKAL